MLVIAALLAAVHAVPTPQLLDTNNLPFYYPESTVVTRPPAHAFANPSETDIGKLAIQTLMRELHATKQDLRIQRQFTDDSKVTHVYVARLVDGIPVANHNAAVHIKNGHVSSFSSSFTNLQSQHSSLINAAKTEILLPEAVSIAQAALGAPKDSTQATIAFLQTANGYVKVHEFQLRDDSLNLWYHVSVDCGSGAIVQVIDYYSRASYNVIKFPKLVPTDGFETVTDEADPTASPLGWNNDGITEFNITKGNNANVKSTRSKIAYYPTSSDLNFKSEWNSSEPADSPANNITSSTHLFYLVNKMHDISYQYGFTEAAGNFQDNNFGKGGEANDSVNVNNLSQDGVNNANFATPPDGQHGRMNMYIFTMTNITRDGSLDSVIPIHEYTHGISNRLTGGAATGNCLRDQESGGMGEGWSDAVGVFIGRSENDTRDVDIAVGWYVLNSTRHGRGIRRYPYSTNMTTNPLTFASYNLTSEVHKVGEIWATTLNELYWNLVDKHGFNSNWLDSKSSHGNIKTMQLVIGGMMLQPCNPKMTQARDAIILADEHYYASANKCDIWAAFAKRGLGVDAVQDIHRDGFAVPSECTPERTPESLPATN